MLILRFDMRAPIDGPAASADLYQTALEMAEWGEQHGCLLIQVSEHHASPDGFLPSPLILAAAIAARTTSAPIMVGAVLLNLYDPIKLAEDMVVLDIVSRGRVQYTIGLGYRAEEYAMFGVEMRRRGKLMDEKLDALKRALAGERFEYQGRPVHVTPGSYTPTGPRLLYGGGSEAAARRAGRFGLGFMAEGGAPGLAQVYRDAAVSAGHEPGMVIIPDRSMATSLFVARDVDAAWQQIGPFLLHDAQMYSDWMGSESPSISKSDASSVEELREENGAYRILTPDAAVQQIRTGKPLALQPLCGGCPPELAWESLRLIAEEVLPALN